MKEMTLIRPLCQQEEDASSCGFFLFVFLTADTGIFTGIKSCFFYTNVINKQVIKASVL